LSAGVGYLGAQFAQHGFGPPSGAKRKIAFPRTESNVTLHRERGGMFSQIGNPETATLNSPSGALLLKADLKRTSPRVSNLPTGDIKQLKRNHRLSCGDDLS
jgi:hypothetical protein